MNDARSPDSSAEVTTGTANTTNSKSPDSSSNLNEIIVGVLLPIVITSVVLSIALAICYFKWRCCVHKCKIQKKKTNL